jgi:hypothetical protein
MSARALLGACIRAFVDWQPFLGFEIITFVMQWLIYNDCVFRTRNIYEFVMFHDRDEFVQIVGIDKPRQVRH